MKHLLPCIFIIVLLNILFPSGPSCAEQSMPIGTGHDIENLVFSIGEWVSFSATEKIISFRFYLDHNGNRFNELVQLSFSESTIFSDAEKNIDPSSIKTGSEVHVEYNPDSNRIHHVYSFS